MHKARIFCAGLLLGVLCSHGAGTLIPYTDGFEAYSLGPIPTTGPWMTNGAGSATVTNSPVYTGSRSCSLSDINLILDIDENRGTYTNVYWRFFTRPVCYEDEDGTDVPTNCADASGAFYISTNGYAKAYVYNGESNAWVQLNGMSIPTNGWVGFEVRIDYPHSNWNIWASTNDFATSTKLNSSDLQFPTNENPNQSLNYVAVYNSGVIDKMMLYLPAAAGGGIGLPFFDGFELYAVGPLTNSAVARQYWSLSGEDAGAVVTSSIYIEGSKSCNATNATLTLQIDENKGVYTNIWCQMYLKPIGYEDDNGSLAPSVADGTAASIYVSTSGWLYAYAFMDGENRWTNMVQVPTSQWIGVAMHMDYSTRLWDLYYTTNGYGTRMTKANTVPLGIQTNASGVGEIGEVVIKDSLALDAVALAEGSVTVTNPPASATANVVAQDLPGGRTNLIAILAHHYGGDENTLVGSLGNDLKSGLADGDRIRVFWTNSWNIYTLVDGSWTLLAGDPGTAPDNMHITSGMGIWVERRNQTNAVAFYPYDTIPTVTNAIYGTNYYWSAGWNLLGWPFLAGTTASSGWGFESFAGQGDTIFMYNNGLYDVKLWWDADGHRWMQGPRASTYMMKKGQTFWYYRAAQGSNTWVVANPSP